ncbi:MULTISPECIES: MXAN_6640 family putative metalloprotease [unclassified Nocardioides]|uniref:MXAN_6640 family putative metalloprotease n=1 Tax=unclassified Nocardioides TaxID=2615069 RepID=UPI0007027D92|nr:MULTISPECIES: MXAN_6640 family putative metalloprotease [unclassified Nocardioides]KRC54876.1 hypothetical protein ASE19_05310 [Nocardioides sp. Root79]KRC73780.1 hypothetical protein ASE20_03910 [Nocardioides sp. Root240]
MVAPSRLSRGVVAAAALLAAVVPIVVVPSASADDDGKQKVLTSSVARDERRVRANAALDRVEKIADGTASEAEKASYTIARRDLRVALRDLGRADQARAAAILARPATDQVLCSATTCVRWATGVATPQFAQLALTTVDQVRAKYQAAGYRAPLGDGTSGGDARTDVYLEDSGSEGLYGYCDSDDPKISTPGAVGFDVSAYCGLDNDFSTSQFPGNPTNNLKVTVAHEFFHAVQFAYDFLEDGWFMEGTAAWVEDEMYTAVNDNRQYLWTSQLRAPGRSLDLFGGGYHYGTWLFFRYLTERFPGKSGGLPSLVRRMWELADGAVGGPDYYSISAVAQALAERGTNLTTQYSRFAMANRSPRSFYREGAAYPKAVASSVVVRASRPNAPATARTLDHLTSATVRYVPSRTTARSWKLKLTLNMADRVRGSAAIVRVFYRSGAVKTINVALSSTGGGVVRVPFSTRTVLSVEVTMANASRRFYGNTCFSYETPLSCGGATPMDDNLRQVVDPVAYR